MLYRIPFAHLVIGASLILTASAPSMAADQARPYAGQTISVLLPPWGTLPKTMMDRFTGETGIKVDMQTLGWDEIRTKIATAENAGTSPADVTELDWSWVGQFGMAGWYMPLDGKLDNAIFSDIASTPVFRFNGKTIGASYNNDFRLLIVNKAHFDKAGVKAMPKNFDQLMADVRAVKKANVAKYPIAVPLSATEGTATAWYLLTKAFGGELFTKDFKPLFVAPASAGYKAVAFEISALKEGLIDPASTSLTDVQVQENFKAGQASVDLAGWAGNLSVYNDASKSKVAGQIVGALMPSAQGNSRSFALPEALGVPNNAKNKDAAVAFIKWYLLPENQTQAYTELSNLPTRSSVLNKLTKEGKLEGGAVLVEQIKGAGPLFAQGTPTWYPALSRSVSEAINQAAKGQLTIAQVVKKIADDSANAIKAMQE